MKNIFLLQICLLLPISVLFAQDTTALFEAKKLEESAKKQAKLRQYDLANEALRTAQHTYQAHEDWSAYTRVSIDLGMNYYRLSKDSMALACFENAIQLVRAKTSAADPSLGLLYHKLGVYWYFLRDYDQAILNYQKAIQLRQKSPTAPNSDLAGSYHNTGVAQSVKGDYEAATLSFKKSIKIRKILLDTIPLAESYGQLGENYSLLGDYQQALSYLEITLDLYQKTYGALHRRVGISYYDIGNVYSYMEEHEKAAEAGQKALTVYNHLQDQKRKANTLHFLGHTYTRLQQYDQALAALQEALAIHEKMFGKESIYVANGLNSLGITYKEQKKYDLALEHLMRSLAIRKKIYAFQKHPKVAIAYDNLGNVWHEKADYAKALRTYQLALSHLIPPFTDTLGYGNPHFQQIQICKDKPKLLTVLMDKAIALKAMLQENQEQEALEKALETFELSSELLDEMRRNYENEGSKLFWSGKIKPFFEEAIETSLLLYAQTQDPQQQRLAFQFAEKSKASLLVENRKALAAQVFAKLPEQLIKKEQAFKTDIVKLQEAIYQKETSQAQEAFKLKDSLLRLHNNYYDFVNQLEKEYPKYYRFKYQKDLIDLPNLRRNIIDENTCLLEYFFGERNIYVFALSRQKLHIEKITRTAALDRAIQQLKATLSKEEQLNKDLLQNYQQFTQAAHQLYQSLLANVLPVFNEKKKLIFIPDGWLAYLPFDCLLQEEVQQTEIDFLHLPYLIRNYEISYAYSATLLQQSGLLNPKQAGRNRLLAFAPSYTEETTLLPLFGAQEEVQKIASYYTTHRVFEKEKATKTNFQEAANQFDIIHLAAHAKVDEGNSQRSCLYFSKTEGANAADHQLYNYELPALDIKAELVVLSACETGRGKLQLGEGVMSLARGFRNAGTATVVMSLWSTNDKSSQQIMVDFHQQLATQQTVANALHQAKLAYLDHPLDPLGHPYYWASFIATGNTQSQLKLDGFTDYYRTGIALGFLLLLVIAFYVLRAQYQTSTAI